MSIEEEKEWWKDPKDIKSFLFAFHCFLLNNKSELGSEKKIARATPYPRGARLFQTNEKCYSKLKTALSSSKEATPGQKSLLQTTSWSVLTIKSV
jgi:hypothetical protein